MNAALPYDLDDGNLPADYDDVLPLAQDGYLRAQYTLACCLLEGRGTRVNPRAAAHWFHRAARSGHASSMLMLGRLYAAGSGVPQDYVLAHMWLNLAAAAGLRGAAELRGRVARRMSKSQVGKAQWLARGFWHRSPRKEA